VFALDYSKPYKPMLLLVLVARACHVPAAVVVDGVAVEVVVVVVVLHDICIIILHTAATRQAVYSIEHVKRQCDDLPSPFKRAALIQLNVGGRKFDASESTLIECKYFASMFHAGFGHNTDDDQRMCIDRDGDLFGILLASLRTGWRPSQSIVEAKRPELLVECDYYGIA